MVESCRWHLFRHAPGQRALDHRVHVRQPNQVGERVRSIDNDGRAQCEHRCSVRRSKNAASACVACRPHMRLRRSLSSLIRTLPALRSAHACVPESDARSIAPRTSLPDGAGPSRSSNDAERGRRSPPDARRDRPDLCDLRSCAELHRARRLQGARDRIRSPRLDRLLIDACEQPNGGTWRIRKQSTLIDISAVVEPEGRLLVVTFIDAQPYDPPSRTSVGRQAAVRSSPRRHLVHVARLVACRVPRGRVGTRSK